MVTSDTALQLLPMTVLSLLQVCHGASYQVWVMERVGLIQMVRPNWVSHRVSKEVSLWKCLSLLQRPRNPQLCVCLDGLVESLGPRYPQGKRHQSQCMGILHIPMNGRPQIWNRSMTQQRHHQPRLYSFR